MTTISKPSLPPKTAIIVTFFMLKLLFLLDSTSCSIGGQRGSLKQPLLATILLAINFNGGDPVVQKTGADNLFGDYNAIQTSYNNEVETQAMAPDKEAMTAHAEFQVNRQRCCSCLPKNIRHLVRRILRQDAEKCVACFFPGRKESLVLNQRSSEKTLATRDISDVSDQSALQSVIDKLVRSHHQQPAFQTNRKLRETAAADLTCSIRVHQAVTLNGTCLTGNRPNRFPSCVAVGQDGHSYLGSDELNCPIAK